MASFNFPVLPKFDRLTALYRPRKSIDIPAANDSPDTSSSSFNQMSMSLTTKGLLNPTGENNCFLNSAVQVLWHIGVFRRSFREVKGHYCVGESCIFCSLKTLFSNFQHDTGQSAIPPDELRQALAVCYEGQHRFQLGLMDDAAECFEKLLEQVHFHMTGSDDLDTCSVDYCIPHQKFALTILERTECRCGATSEPLSFVQFVHYISSSAFSKESQRLRSGPPSSPGADQFSKIVNAASAFGESRQCSNYTNCKQDVVTKRILLNSPDVFALGLIWDSAAPSVDDIMSVVSNIGLTLQLNEVFDHVFSDTAQCNQLELTALIAYYGRHYSTFCFHTKLNQWIYFDDAKFRTIGSDWSLVCDQIRKAHYQPLLLVYTNRFGDNVDTSKAPTEVILQPLDSRPSELPILEETEEELELANQIADEAVPVTTTHSIDPLTLSIVPSTAVSREATKTKVASSEDLMMFSISPLARPHPTADSAKQTSLETSTQKTSSSTQPHTSTPSQSHIITTSQSPTLTPTHSLTSSTPSQTTVRPRPHAQTTQANIQPKMRMSTKADVSVEETKVEAQQHGYQGNDLMTFSIAPTKATSPSKSGHGDGEGSDLIKFSLSDKDLARLHNQPTRSHDSAHGLRNSSNSSHELTPKWDHFSRQNETNFGVPPSPVGRAPSKVGGASDAEHWAVLTINGPEKVLVPEDLVTSDLLTFDTPAVKSLKRMASQPSEGKLPSSVGKVPSSATKAPSSPAGKPPSPLGKVPPTVGKVPSSDAHKPDFSKRELPELPTQRPKVHDQTGTYVELDFQHAPQGQRSGGNKGRVDKGQSSKGKVDDRTEYAEISFTNKTSHGAARPKSDGHVTKPVDHVTKSGGHVTKPDGHVTKPGGHVTKSDGHVTERRAGRAHTAGDVSLRNSAQPIGEDPLYALPEQVKRRMRATDTNVGGLPVTIQSQLSEARDLLAKAKAVRGSDDTVALLLLTQYRSVLDKVLRDPEIRSRALLSRQIQAKRDEGVKLFNELKPKDQDVRVTRAPGKCSRCDMIRDLDSSTGLCGPCVLRVRIAS